MDRSGLADMMVGTHYMTAAVDIDVDVDESNLIVLVHTVLIQVSVGYTQQILGHDAVKCQNLGSKVDEKLATMSGLGEYCVLMTGRC